MSRVLWFHPRPWGPPRGGGDLRTHGLVNCALASGHTVGLVVPAGPHPDTESAGLSVIEFVPRRGAALVAHKVASRHPLRSPRMSARAAAATHADIEQFAPDVGVVSEVMSWSIARRLLPAGLPWAYDAVNIESQLFRDLAAGAHGLVDRLSFGVDARRVARDERDVLRNADAVLSVSQTEGAVLAGMAGTSRVEVVPQLRRESRSFVGTAGKAGLRALRRHAGLPTERDGRARAGPSGDACR